MINKYFLLFALMVCLSLRSYAALENTTEKLGVALPYEISLAITKEKLNLNGYAVATQWGTQVYVGALYTPQNEKRTEMLLINDQPLAMIFYFVRDDITSQMFSKAFIEAIMLNNGDWDDKKRDRTRIIEVKELLDKTFNAGDILGFYYSPSNGVLMTINGEIIHHWPHAKSFFNMLLRTWVGPYPPSRGFKRAIMNFPVN